MNQMLNTRHDVSNPKIPPSRNPAITNRLIVNAKKFTIKLLNFLVFL